MSCLPVLVLGVGSALAHLLRSDAASANAQSHAAALQTGDQKLAGHCLSDCSGPDQPGTGQHVASAWPDSSSDAALFLHHDAAETTRELVSPRAYVVSARPPARMRPSEAYTAAARVIASGQRISRRSLRSAGLRGSNADLGML